MPNINENLDLFIRNLNKNKRIIIYNENWSIDQANQSTYFLLKYCNQKKEEKRVLDIIHSFSSLLDKLERNLIPSEKIEKVETYTEASEAITSYVHRCYSNHSSAIHDALIQLKRRHIALYYRHYPFKDIHSFTPLEKLHNVFTFLAENWKQLQPFGKLKNVSLSERDKSRLYNASRYSLFVQLLYENNTLQDNFFNWILRDNNEAEPFIEFPATADRLHSCFIDKRVGYYNPDELHIQSNEEKSTLKKYLQLPFYIQGRVSRINILDESHVIDFSSRKVSIKTIFDEFANKRMQHGKYEFLQNGISEWCSDDFVGDIFQCSYTAALKESLELKENDTLTFEHLTVINKKINYFPGEWWKNLPVFQVLSKENIKLRYGITTLPDNQWITCLRTTTTSLEYQILQNHGFIEIAIPEEKTENYFIYPFGLYPKEFPRHLTAQVKSITATLPAKIEYPDSNIFKSDYFHAFLPTFISPEEGFKLMQSIQIDLLKIFTNHLPIQVTSENCAFWAGDKFIKNNNEYSKNPFELTFAEMKPSNNRLQLLTKLPKVIESPFVAGLRFFAAYNALEIKTEEKTVNKQIHFVDSIKHQTLYSPIKLARQIKEYKVTGVLRFGQ